MCVRKLSKFVVSAMLALPLALGSTGSWAQQILEEVGMADDDEIARPDFDSLNPTQTSWVAPAGNRDFRAFAMSITGEGLVLDGNMIRAYTSSGAVSGTPGFPFSCTALLFNAPKKNGTPQEVSLSECHSFTPKNDGSIQIAGAIKGTRFVLIRHDPSTGQTTLLADGTPPVISDMDSDQFADAGDRLGLGTYMIGERKKVIFAPEGNEQNFSAIATLNGSRIDAVTPFGPNRVIVVLDDGELLSVHTGTGVATPFATQNPGAECGLGKKDPQRFSARATPLGRLYVGSLGCQNIAIYDNGLNLLSVSTELAANPFLLNMPAFSPNSLDWRSGQGGDWEDCDGSSVAEGCTYSQQPEGARAFSVQTVEGPGTSFRMFQFILKDCRWSGDRPCPIVNCASADGGVGCDAPLAKDQVLNLAKLLERSDPSGEFAQAAYPDPDNPPPMTIPAYVRGEEFHPGSLVYNDYVFYSFFAVTDAVFHNVFFTQYDLDALRLPTISNDLCTVGGPNTSVFDMNELANLIIYNRDKYDTIDRGPVEGNKGGTVINSFCNRGGAASFDWSSQSVGLEFHCIDEDCFLEFTALQYAELQDTKDQLLCSQFTDPDTSALVGPLLGTFDCDLIQGHLDQIGQKLEVCHDSALTVQQGNSQENCNALKTKIDNLQFDLGNIIGWPDPTLPVNLPVLGPNYEGEFTGRLASFEFAIEDWFLNAIPPGGITPSP